LPKPKTKQHKKLTRMCSFFFRYKLRSICSQHLAISRIKRNRITAFVFFKPDEIIKSAFFPLLLPTKTKSEAFIMSLDWTKEREREEK
jgi:hypothetical protein